MASYNITVNLGSGDEGKRRNDAYRLKAAEDNLSLGAWAKKCMDSFVNLESSTENKPLTHE